MKTEHYVQRFSEHMTATGRSVSTIEWAEVLLARFLEFAESEGVKEPGKVTTKLMLDYQIHVSALETRKGELYTADMQNRHLAVVRKFYDYLMLCGEVTVNPTVGLEYARCPKRLPRGILSPEQMIGLIEQPLKPSRYPVLGKRDHALLTLLYATAVRRGELLGLDVKDVLLAQKSVFVREGKWRKDRVVPMGGHTTMVIKAYIKKTRPRLVTEPTGDALFPCAWTGHRMTKHAIKYLIDKYARQAGLTEPVTPHTFRHSAASHILHNAKGNCLRELQEYLGHADLSTTGIYLHVSIPRLKELFKEAHPLERQDVA